MTQALYAYMNKKKKVWDTVRGKISETEHPSPRHWQDKAGQEWALSFPYELSDLLCGMGQVPG
jgi:hypothetical protein